VDVHRFRDLVARAQSADGQTALRLLDEALGLWRDEALAGLDTPWLANVRESLEAERHAAELDRNDLALAAGRHAALLGPLTQLAAAHPLDERLAGQLILALYRCGRQADALRRYERLRLRLAEELGADPGPRLQLLHHQMLATDPGLTVDGSGGAPTALLATPRHLPAPPRWFAGRAWELAELDAALATAVQSSTVAISAVSGTAGVGKTALALRWANRVAHEFTDGQLCVNLRGFGPHEPMTSAEAVRVFLDGLGVPPARVPAGLDAQVGLYRSLLAGRRILVLLDNAVDADQVRPLLPTTPGSLALITSRNSLNGLVVADGARRIVLDLLPAGDARQLLADRLGSERTAAEPDAVEQIITGCARLPLALSVAAAYAVNRSDASLGAVAAQLAGGLEMFDGGDPATDVRSVLSWSYRALSTDVARLFRQLSVHPGPDFTALAAASLAGVPARQAQAALSQLTGAHLIHEHVPGRFALHDLLHAYARELAEATEPVTEWQATTRRLLDHYLHTASEGDGLLNPHRDRIAPAAAAVGVVPEPLADAVQAMAWFTAEHRVLLAVAETASRTGFDTHAWQLPIAIASFLGRRGHWHDWLATQRRAVDAARRVGDAAAQAHSHRGLARAYVRLNRHDDAVSHLRSALEHFQALHHADEQAYTLLNIAWARGQQGRDDEAIAPARQGLELYRSTGHRNGQANALAALGWYHTHLGDHRPAIAYCEEALALYRDGGDRHGEAATLDSLGLACHRLGEHERAIVYYRRACELMRKVGDRYNEAEVLIHLGEVHRDLGAGEASRLVWQRALDILEHLEHPDAETVRTNLENLARADAAQEPAVHQLDGHR
jgi:tetratricopeptide (TPR) repeat protein